MKKWSVRLTNLVLLAFLLSWGYVYFINPNINPFYAPEINPHPQYFMTIKGHIDPTLPDKLKVKFIAGYETENPSCEYTVNALEGVYSSYERTLSIMAKPNDKGNYLVKIPIDRYKRGECQWVIRTLEYYLEGTPFSSKVIAFFVDPMNDPFHYPAMVGSQWSCDNSLDCDWNSFKSYGSDLPNNHSYAYRLDINRK